MSTQFRNAGQVAVAAAESIAFDGTDLEVVVPFERLTELEESVMGSPWWPGPVVPVRIARRDARSSSTVHGRVSEVRLARPQHTVATMVHELAHVLAGVPAAHGAVFRRAHVDVARVALGPERARWLDDAYGAVGLRLGERSWPAPPSAHSGPIAL